MNVYNVSFTGNLWQTAGSIYVVARSVAGAFETAQKKLDSTMERVPEKLKKEESPVEIISIVLESHGVLLEVEQP